MTARDRSIDPIETTVPMVVTVFRNTPPYFPGSNLYNRNVGDETRVGATIVVVSAVDDDDEVSLTPCSYCKSPCLWVMPAGLMKPSRNTPVDTQCCQTFPPGAGE